jgi:hypothetical protein
VFFKACWGGKLQTTDNLDIRLLLRFAYNYGKLRLPSPLPYRLLVHLSHEKKRLQMTDIPEI